MNLRNVPATIRIAVTCALLPCMAAGNGWTNEKAGTRPAHREREAVAELPGRAQDAAPPGAVVIERRLGDRPSEAIVVRQGTAVRLVLHASAGTDLHLHGYDLTGTATGAAPVVMTFRADHAGRFPIEAHGVGDALGRTHRALAYVEVRPE